MSLRFSAIATLLNIAWSVCLCGAADEKSLVPEGTSVVELPRPNSGTYTFEQAAARKDEILSNEPSKRLDSYPRPYMGFSIHVEADDSFSVYAPSAGAPSGEYPLKRQTVNQIMDIESHTIMFGNPHGVLITSDRQLKDSKTFPALLKVLNVPSIQLFYLQKKE